MINATSPTIAAMLNNTPQGYGNMYNPQVPNYGMNVGPQPTPNSFNTPYPSPKDMLAQAGQMNVYQPTSFAPTYPPTHPQNIIGGYNPGYQAAFASYSNPYMGYGYSGFNPAIYNPQILMMPPEQFRDPVTMSIYEASQFSGLSFKDQLELDSQITKKLTSIVCRFKGMEDEQIEEICDAYTIYDRSQVNNFEYIPQKPEKPFSVSFVDEDGTEYSSPIPTDSKNYMIATNTYISNVRALDYDKMRRDQEEALNRAARISLYNKSVARKYDNTPFYEFINDGGLAEVVIESRAVKHMQFMQDLTRKYDQERFRKLVEASRNPDGINTPNGMLPDGRFLSPNHDPSIASSFSLNPNGHTYDITMPDVVGRQNNFAIDRNGNTEIMPAFTANNYESARISFMKTLDTPDLPKV